VTHSVRPDQFIGATLDVNGPSFVVVTDVANFGEALLIEKLLCFGFVSKITLDKKVSADEYVILEFVFTKSEFKAQFEN
jgi:hypothetical protein